MALMRLRGLEEGACLNVTLLVALFMANIFDFLEDGALKLSCFGV